jgi:protein arginine kinase activator
MADKIQCESCGKPATVHLTHIVDKTMQKVDLCEECASKMGVTKQPGFNLQELLSKSLSDEQAEAAEKASDADSGARCEVCGYTLGRFKQSGRLGCPHCYDTFEKSLSPVLKDMHRDTRHLGKVPEVSQSRVATTRALQKLQDELATAIQSENYEEAARLRDAIREQETSKASADRSSKS